MTTLSSTPPQVYFYDAQLRRILVQFSRIFTGFRVKTGTTTANGYQESIIVPVVFGDGSRQAQSIINNVSENTVLSIPRIAVSFQDLKPMALNGRGSYQGNSETLLAVERKYDHDTGLYGKEQGHKYQIDRLYPVPIDIEFKVDIWTSNTDQKFQLIEQILLLFNPSLDIQTTANPLDWTALNTVTLYNLTWNSNSTGGTEDAPNVMSLSFMTSCWINPPSRVKKQELIENIIMRMGESIAESQTSSPFLIVTPGNHGIRVENDEIYLLGPNQNLTSGDDIYSWPKLIDKYGEIKSGESKIALRWVDDITDESKDVLGYITLDPVIDNLLHFEVITDTMPATTQNSVLDMIDPYQEFPGKGLPDAINGHRYILTNSISGTNVAWGTLTADPGDIIQYDGADWLVVFDASEASGDHFVLVQSFTKTLKLFDTEWIDIINSDYGPGYFTLML